MKNKFYFTDISDVSSSSEQRKRQWSKTFFIIRRSIYGLIQFWQSSGFVSSNYFQIWQHVVLLPIIIITIIINATTVTYFFSPIHNALYYNKKWSTIAGVEPGFFKGGGVKGQGALYFETFSGGRFFILVLRFVSFSKTVSRVCSPSQGALFYS
jgi:hypothetical protein